MLKKVGTILGIVISVGIIFGAIFTQVRSFDNRFAKAEEISEVKENIDLLSERLDQKILTDREYSLQQRIWRLEDRYGNIDGMPGHIRDNYRELQKDLDDTRDKLNDLK